MQGTLKRGQTRTFGINWLRERLCDRQRHDRRVETALAMLQRHGLIEDEIDLGKVEILVPLPESLADEESRAAKLMRDQKKLYALVQYVQAEGDRKRFIHGCFGLQLPQVKFLHDNRTTLSLKPSSTVGSSQSSETLRCHSEIVS